ncbi:SDR family NAD(P)-dependent oxidoreductase [Paenibacillus abyssi]|uniref:Beta-ketoacyl-ACP reductase n=2 Tax=Paenibacillus abyssi TaxID=1340531 RepID=A0A917CUM2_9BACL|nr:SDR family oxidoreductase [Paenibacillus abyssi]GGF99460.1 beta-ketoacyl-ACP reductase [Paenibacillus abyssi]
MGVLDGRVALISGAGTGLGNATAIAYAREGAAVILVGRRKGKLEETAQEIAAVTSGKGQTLVYPADVSSESQINAAVQAAVAAFGNIDVLVNNAAVFEPGLVIELTAEEWDKQIAVNLTGPFLLTRAVLPIMRKSRYGRIINITSSLASNGAGGYAAYSAAKAGLESLTRTLADEEHENGIIANLYNPGTVKSEMHATGKEASTVTPDLIRLASLPAGSPTGTLVTYK